MHQPIRIFGNPRISWAVGLSFIIVLLFLVAASMESAAQGSLEECPEVVKDGSWLAQMDPDFSAYEEGLCRLHAWRVEHLRDGMYKHSAAEYLTLLDQIHQEARELDLDLSSQSDRLPTLHQVEVWLQFLVRAEAVEPVPLQLERQKECGRDVTSDPTVVCWVMYGDESDDLVISAEFVGDWGILWVSYPDFTFNRVCTNILVENAQDLWECPIDEIFQYDPLIDDPCVDTVGIWTREGHVDYWKAEDGAFCEPFVPPVEKFNLAQ